VAEATQRLARDVARTFEGADVAVLVRDDDGVWRVEAGVGLRTFEHGQHLPTDHWLVQAGRDRGPTLVVRDTDAVRTELVGAPLASRRQLVRTQLPNTPLMVCAGWSDDETRVPPAELTTVVRRHESDVRDAVALRQVVRALERQVAISTRQS
jgi:hypothetical protein